MVEGPAPDGVYVTEHSFVPLAGSEQLAALKLPASPAAFEKLTVPVARMPLPAAELSLTVAVQVEPWLMTTFAGVHATVVDESRLAAVTVLLSLLVRWAVSPP